MYISYNYKEYRLGRKRAEYYLFSSNPDSLLEGFIQKDGSFFKRIDEDFASANSYDFNIYVQYDTKLEKVPVLWKIETYDIESDRVKLLFTEGYLPGWKVEEKYISSTYISYDEVEQIFCEKTDAKGEILSKQTITKDELLELVEHLRNI